MTDFVERIFDVPGFFPICPAQPEKRQADPPLLGRLRSYKLGQLRSYKMGAFDRAGVCA
jgi:hypothetical protein